MKKKILSLLLCMLVAMSFTGCGSTKDDNTKKVSKNDNTPIVFAASRYAGPGAKDAYYCSSALKVWESLIDKGPDNTYRGVLVKSYDHSSDYKTWTFKLRKNVKFHDGEPFNADAVMANLERMKHNINSTYTLLSYNRSFPGIENVKKIDEYTLQFNFKNPVPDLLVSMSGYGSPMFSPKCFGPDGNFTKPAQGTGPFKIKEEKPEQYVLVERNDNYWGDKAKTKYIKIKTIKDPDTRMAALKSEEVMGVVDLGAVEPAMAEELKKTGKFDVSTYKSSMTHLIGFNCEKAPFNDKKFREAVSLLIDRTKIVNTIFAGYGKATTNAINHVSPYYVDTPIEHDVKKAEKLAKEVLHGKTVKAKIILRQLDCNRYPQEKVAVYLKSVLKKINVDADIQILENQAYLETMKGNDWDITVGKRQLPAATLEIISSFIKKDGTEHKNYHMSFHSDKADKLIDEVRYETNLEKRKKIYKELQEIIYNEKLVVPYLHDVSLVVSNKKIKGYKLNYQGTTIPETMWAD